MKKGFTLIELLAVIILLAIIALIAYPTLNNVISKNKDKLYEKQISELERHANTWIMDHAETFELENGDSYLLSFEELYNSGLINSKEVKDPRNSENIKGCIAIIRNNTKYDIKYSEECKATYDCTFDGELVQGAEYVNGQYTYRYKKDVYGSNIDEDGWSVKITDRNSTDPITTKLCSSINGKPIVSMKYMFDGAKAQSVDLSSFDTSNVVDMSYMFAYSNFLSLDLSSFDTSNVKTMAGMFSLNPVTEIKFGEKFNTSKVTTMYTMFGQSKVVSLDLSNFDTSNVTNMSSMFYGSESSEIKFGEKFNTSNVTDMSQMFGLSKVVSLDLSTFDTSKVTNMTMMFIECQATTGYAKTGADADKFNASSNKPDTLTFVVKP